jgi:hypothetical protein
MQNRSRTPKRPRDFNSRAFQTVAILTGTAPPEPEPEPEDPVKVAARELGRRGGLKGGAARSAKMTPAERSEAARKAARARWNKSSNLD